MFFESNSKTATQNFVLGQEYVQSRIGKRLCDGEALFLQGKSEYRLPHITDDKQFLKARLISDTSKTQLKELRNHFPNKPVGQCADINHFKKRAETTFVVHDEDD